LSGDPWIPGDATQADTTHHRRTEVVTAVRRLGAAARSMNPVLGVAGPAGDDFGRRVTTLVTVALVSAGAVANSRPGRSR